MGTQYSIEFDNNSTLNSSICVYQKYPIYDKNVYSLAWFAKKMVKGSSAIFRWEIDYSFLCSEKGDIAPGVYFETSLKYKADPANTDINSVDFYLEDDCCNFEYVKERTSRHSLGIKVDAKIPNDKYSIGIGMGGKAIFATAAKTNMNFVFTPHPRYFITFGDFKEGYVIDANMYTDARELVYEKNFYTAVVTLNQDNTFDISYK